jgi:hypothetical protein
MDIKYKYKTKVLGLHLTENTKLDVHIKNSSSKLSQSYYVMQSLKGTSVHILKSMYLANFHLHEVKHTFLGN